MVSHSQLLYFTDYTESNPTQDLSAQALGEHWTKDGILKQSLFLSRYAKNLKLQAAWLLGVSACVADDESTLHRLTDAVQSGVSLQDACQIAIALDSRMGAQALSALGVDWKSQYIMPSQRRFAGDDGRVDSPNSALVEAIVEGELADSRYMSSATLRNVIDEAAIFQRSAFLLGALESGLDHTIEIQSPALGLASGNVKLLSLLIANQQWGPVEYVLSKGNLSQDVIDEALLACAMRTYLPAPKQNSEQEANITSKLIEMGANVDRVYEFSFGATKLLYSELLQNYDRVSRQGYLSARQWAISGALIAPRDKSDEFTSAYLENLPSLPTGTPNNLNPSLPIENPTWFVWAFSLPRDSRAPEFEGLSAELLSQLLTSEAQNKKSLSYLLDCAMEEIRGGDWGVFNMLASTPAFKDLKGELGLDTFMECVDFLLENVTRHTTAFSGLSDGRLHNLTRLLSTPDQKTWEIASEPWLRLVRSLAPQERRPTSHPSRWSGVSKEDDQALELGYQATKEAISKPLSAKTRPRRSL